MSKPTLPAKIVLATGNKGKVREIQSVLADLGTTIVPQSDLKVPEADENGLSFVENAILKARNACLHTGLPAMADDSGIEVDALNGAPGIYSARYAGPGSTDQSNNEKLLEMLSLSGKQERSARFQCVIVYLRHANDPMPQIFQGTWEGEILEKASGAHGFGYDPLFFVPDYNCSAAELAPEVKNRLSHRGQALQKLVNAFHA